MKMKKMLWSVVLLFSILISACRAPSQDERTMSEGERNQANLYYQAQNNSVYTDQVSFISVCYNNSGDATLSFTGLAEKVDAKKLDQEGFVLMGENLVAFKQGANNTNESITGDKDIIQYIVFFHTPGDTEDGLINKLKVSVVTDELIVTHKSFWSSEGYYRSYLIKSDPNVCYTVKER